MSEFLLPEKRRVINSPSQLNLSFTNLAGAIVPASTASICNMEGFHTLRVPQTSNVRLVRGLANRRSSQELNSATGAQITVGTVPAANTRVSFEFNFQTTSRAARFARPEYEFAMKVVYNVNLQVGDTAAIVLAKLHNSMVVDRNARNRDLVINVVAPTTGTFATVDNATSITRLVFEADDEGTTFVGFKALGDNGLPSSVVTTFNPIVNQAFVRGVGRGSVIEFGNKTVGGNNSAYFPDFDEIPVQNQLYTEISFMTTIVPSVGQMNNSNMNNTSRFVLFLNESTCQSMLTTAALTGFFHQFLDTQYSYTSAGVYLQGILQASVGPSGVNFITNA